MRMLCYKCGHSWNYKGNLFYITCPSCSYKIRKDKALIESVESKQELLTILPKKKELPTKIPVKLPTTTNFERVYFPNGFDCLIHKDIAAQFRKLTLKDLKKEKPVVEFMIEEKGKIKEFDNISDFHLEVQNQEYENSPITIKEIKNDLDIKIIPIDPIKILEHQRSFF